MGKVLIQNTKVRDSCGTGIVDASQGRPRRQRVDRGGSRIARGKGATEVSSKHKFGELKPHNSDCLVFLMKIGYERIDPIGSFQ
ncbi:hypothetical protein P343_05005 [Sporolactobacillus laevolacticus DSM 442]|uniref:Uncharacterized protein n=1 Tax=Sporolactobacillus laevolacticus DSM 442 TaxID=1395513 RepID=V6J7I1_9BACL|nr:hypothetical protein P343_05005 [Sporolactobacillus laevolacticus DSM 442]